MFYIKERRAYITEENRVVYDYGVNLVHDVFEGYTQGNTYEKIVESFETMEEAYNALEKYTPGRYDFGNGIEAQIDWFIDCETDQKASQYTWEPIIVL